MGLQAYKAMLSPHLQVLLSPSHNAAQSTVIPLSALALPELKMYFPKVLSNMGGMNKSTPSPAGKLSDLDRMARKEIVCNITNPQLFISLSQEFSAHDTELCGSQSLRRISTRAIETVRTTTV